jgi:acetyl-CoA synthetase
MRRVIAGISNFTEVGDVTTLANPEIVDDIREQVQGEKADRGQQPPELTQEEHQEIKTFGESE